MSKGLLKRTGAWLRALLRDNRGQGDLMTSLLLTAAGAVMVGVTVPSLFESSESAARTFKGQVDVLERGATPSRGGGGIGIGLGGWDINIGSGGVSVSGGRGSFSVGSGGVSGSFGGSRGGVTVSAGGGGGSVGASGGGGGTGVFAQPAGGVSLSRDQGSLGGNGNQGLIRDAILNP